MSRTIDIYCPTCGHMEEVERVPSPPVKVAIFERRLLVRVDALATAAEAKAFADGAHVGTNSGVSVYILPKEEEGMRKWEDSEEVAKAMERTR